MQNKRYATPEHSRRYRIGKRFYKHYANRKMRRSGKSFGKGNLYRKDCYVWQFEW